MNKKSSRQQSIKLTLVAFFLAAIFCFACNAKSTTSSSSTTTEEKLLSRAGQERVLNQSEEKTEGNLAPITDTLNIPVVDFSAIELLLQKNDDTLRVFNFWATWCKPCVEELPLFQEISKAYTNQALQQIFISLDFPNQIDSKLVPFLKTNPLPGDVIILDDPDANSWIDKVDPSWSGSIPATIIQRNGKTSFHEGKFNEFSDIQKIIQSL